jgi:hypothetical protein
MTVFNSKFDRWYGTSKYTQVIYDNPQNRRMCLDGFEAGVRSTQAENLALRQALVQINDIIFQHRDINLTDQEMDAISGWCNNGLVFEDCV